MASKPMRGWNDEANANLLLAFMDVIKPNKAMITEVTAAMTAMGYAYSFDAINQHVQKLRRPRDPTAVGKAQLKDETVSTPTKKTQARTPGSGSGRKRKTPSKSVKKEMSPIDDNDETESLKAKVKEEGEAPRPKKVKKESTPLEGEEDEI
ncbi:hypothetical protein CDD81_3297 [Ophiocordyceps australis]|uniref:Uncharacterized protein n=1 Tax=Ophiocordyceps australis TaxID=1399860 RepID=A0A2C5YBS9_9HYPO|nr:hypothetical protein CDD81_3297 [Ophiocordyceps australis]